MAALDLAVSAILRVRQVQSALINLIRHKIAHVTIRLRFAVVQHDLLFTFIRIFHGITEAFGAGSTAWHRGILLLRNTSRLLIDLHLVQINRQLTIAFVIDIAPVIVCDARLASIVVVVTITITIIIVNTTLRKVITGEHG